MKSYLNLGGGKESAYPSAQEDSAYCLANDPTYGQCAVTAMLVNKFFGGEIRKLWVSGGGTHYFNIINGKIIDLTREQSDILQAYIIPEYEVLRTQSKEYIVDDIITVMRNRIILPWRKL